MKRLYTLIMLVLVISTYSCDEFLKEEPVGSIGQEQFFKNKDDVERATLVIYKVLNSTGLYGRYWPVIDVGTDDVGTVNNKTGMQNFAGYSLSGDQEWFSKSAVWDSWWQGVNYANFVISNVKEMPDIDNDYKNQIMAEAMCMRAFFYFNLVRAWGDVPIITWFVNNENYTFTSQLKREKVQDVYDNVIIPDLVFASDYAPAFQEMKGRATKWLARTILADVYVTLAGYRRDSETGNTVKGEDKNWELAKNAAERVVFDSECPYGLLTDKGLYTNAYARIWEESFSQESLLETGTISEAGNGSWITRECWSHFNGVTFWGPNANAKPFGDSRTINSMGFPGAPRQGIFIPCPDLFHAMEANDLRKWGIMTRYDENKGTTAEKTYLCQPVFMKYVDLDVATAKLGTSFQYADRNFVIYRYADAMLLYAEADNEVNGPTDRSIELINQIRRRAGLNDLTSDKYDSKETFRNAIRQERRIELHAECKRRFDLIRWNIMSEETRDMDVYWMPSDNLKPDGINSYMDKKCQLIYTASVPSPGCETVTEAPAVFRLLPIPTEELYRTGWSNNSGY